MKRRFTFPSLALLTFCLLSCQGLAANDKPGIKVAPTPDRTTVAATLIRNGKWHSLDDDTIANVKKLLEGKNFELPEGVRHVSLPPLSNKVIFWGRENDKLVQIETIEFDNFVHFLSSSAKGYLIQVADSSQRTHLLDLLDKFKEDTNSSNTQARGDETRRHRGVLCHRHLRLRGNFSIFRQN
jgi:hypothetical protein